MPSSSEAIRGGDEMEKQLERLAICLMAAFILMFQGGVICAPEGGMCPETQVCGDVEIKSAEDLAALSGVVSIDGALMIIETPLDNVDGLESLEWVRDGILISGNNELKNLGGLRGLVDVGCNHSGPEPTYFDISYNPSLEDVDGLSNLECVRSTFRIAGNDAMTDLDGLDSLEAIGAELLILGNDTLTSITGLSKLSYLGELPNGTTTMGGGLLRVSTNPFLPTCQAEALAEKLISDGFQGEVTIYGNDDETECVE
jgi:hypothetical protein